MWGITFIIMTMSSSIVALSTRRSLGLIISPSTFSPFRQHPLNTYRRAIQCKAANNNNNNNNNDDDDNDTVTFTILDPPSTQKCKNNNKNNKNKLSSSYSKRDLSKVLTLAERAAISAGRIMMETCGKISISKTKANSRDLVTKSDLECQRNIRDIISSQYPMDLFLGEEDVSAGSDASINALKNVLNTQRKRSNDIDDDEDEDDEEDLMLWIVDPIDGTTNFQSGLPLFCASIGVVSIPKDNHNLPEIVVGVIYNPILNERMSAVKGHGCYLNGKRIQRPKDHSSTALDEALINIGFPVSKESTLLASSRAVSALATKVRGLRMIASATQVMSWVARGNLHAYISWDLNAWDIAAGMLIVREAGGQVCDFDGLEATVSSRDLIVTCSGGSDLQQDLRSVLEENNCLKY